MDRCSQIGATNDQHRTMSLDRQWEKFRGGPTASNAERIRVTLNREGLIYMNAKAYAAFGRPKAAYAFAFM